MTKFQRMAKNLETMLFIL